MKKPFENQLEESDSDEIDYENYKGIFCEENEEMEKYIDPKTGAHFKFLDICNKLRKLIPSNDQSTHEVFPQKTDQSRNKSSQANYYVTNVINYNLNKDSKINMSFNNCYLPLGKHLNNINIKHYNQHLRNKSNESLGNNYLTNADKKVFKISNNAKHTRNHSEIVKATKNFNNDMIDNSKDCSIIIQNGHKSKNVLNDYFNIQISRNKEPNTRPHSRLKNDNEPNGLISKYINKTRNMNEFQTKKTIGGLKGQSVNKHNKSFDMELHKKKTDITKIHHINLKHYIPNIKKIHLNNYIEKGDCKNSSQVRKRIQPSNNHIFKTTNASYPLQKKGKTINETIKKEGKQISEENLQGKSNIIIKSKVKAFKNLHLNPKIMYNILKHH